MNTEKLKTVLAVGETVAVEFKRCGNGISPDTYETVCSFLNRFGGDIYLGVEDNGSVCGIPENAAPDLVKNIIGMVSNPDIINPTVYLAPEIIKYEGKNIIHIHILRDSLLKKAGCSQKMQAEPLPAALLHRITFNQTLRIRQLQGFFAILV